MKPFVDKDFQETCGFMYITAGVCNFSKSMKFKHVFAFFNI